MREQGRNETEKRERDKKQKLKEQEKQTAPVNTHLPFVCFTFSLLFSLLLSTPFLRMSTPTSLSSCSSSTRRYHPYQRHPSSFRSSASSSFSSSSQLLIPFQHNDLPVLLASSLPCFICTDVIAIVCFYLPSPHVYGPLGSRRSVGVTTWDADHCLHLRFFDCVGQHDPWQGLDDVEAVIQQHKQDWGNQMEKGWKLKQVNYTGRVLTMIHQWNGNGNGRQNEVKIRRMRMDLVGGSFPNVSLVLSDDEYLVRVRCCCRAQTGVHWLEFTTNQHRTFTIKPYVRDARATDVTVVADMEEEYNREWRAASAASVKLTAERGVAVEEVMGEVEWPHHKAIYGFYLAFDHKYNRMGRRFLLQVLVLLLLLLVSLACLLVLLCGNCPLGLSRDVPLAYQFNHNLLALLHTTKHNTSRRRENIDQRPPRQCKQHSYMLR